MNLPRLCLPMLLAPLAAQSAPNLIGVTLNTPLIAEIDHGTCSVLSTCAALVLPPVLPPVPVFWPGGATWDAQTNGLWTTTGNLLANITPGTCNVNCGPVACPVTVGSWCTGLDLHEGTGELWFIDSAGWITTTTRSCTPAITNGWPTGLVAAGNLATTGITVDELRGLVFYSTADFGVGSGSIYVAPIANPGAWFQLTPVQDCLPAPTLITGLAVDAANAVLYWTSGRGTFAWSYTYNPSGPSVAFTPGACCQQSAPFGDPLTDLAIRWGGATSTGGPCANGNCQPCPMVHSLRTAPLLGSMLQLGLDQAQPGTVTLCGVDVGPCNAAGPVIPPFCGPLMLPLTSALLVLGPGFPVGPGPCQASATEQLLLPSNPALVGTVLSSQFVSLCSPGGTAMSNCLSWALQ
jgi:hypothetical protein